MSTLFFNPKKSLTVRISGSTAFALLKRAGALGKVFGYLLTIFLLISVFSFFDILDIRFRISVALSSIFSGFYIIFFLLNLFTEAKIKKIYFSESNNLADFLKFEVAVSVSETLKAEGGRANSDFLARRIIKNNKKLNFVFSRLGVTARDIDKLLSKSPDRENDLEEVIRQAFSEKRGDEIDLGDIMIALSEKNYVLKEFFQEMGIQREDIIDVVEWMERIESAIKKDKRFWEWSNLVKKGSLARDWASGYSFLLDSFSTDWTRVFKKNGFPNIVGHEKEIESLERVLSKREINNALLVGESGSGRKSMIYGIAKKSFFGESSPEVNYKRIVELDINEILSQTGETEKTERVIDSIFKEVVSSGNIILVINNIHKALEGNNISLPGILSSYLSYSDFQIIAITDFAGYHKTIERNSSFFSFFEKIEVSEITEKETLILLENFSLFLEDKNNKFISYFALKEAIRCAAKYSPNIPFPKKAMDLLDEAMIHLNQKNENVLLPRHIHKVISEKSQVPVGELERKEKDILLSLESLIHKRVVNQEEAIREVCYALRRSRAEISESQRPMGSFLFLGPTGVGKTETAKALAENYFGTEKEIIRIDMSEFQNISDIGRIIGSSGGEGILTSKVSENPFSLVLLDEVEKAHPEILNLFLQVLDEGHLTDGFGRRVDFKHTIIIATSNAGYKMILKGINEGTEWQLLKKNILDFLYGQGTFRPEFINRFDAVVLFKVLTKDDLLKIAGIHLEKIRRNLKEKNISFEVTEELKEKVVEIGYNPIYGARELRRTIQDKIENVLATAVLSEEIQRGDKITINSDDFSIVKNL